MADAISVCVPYWNRQVALDRMVKNYADMYPHLPLQFNICDDGSWPPARVPFSWTLTRLPQKNEARNPCVPINRAVGTATSDIIVLTNPEVEHREPVLHEMLTLLDTSDAYVVARCRHASRYRNDGLWLAGPDTDYNGYGREPVPPGGHFHFLAMFRSALWQRAGGFDEEYRDGTACDDNDWLWRVYEAGAVFKTTQGVVWHHRDGETIWKATHNRRLFARKWPKARRKRVIQYRTATQGRAL